MRSNLVRDQDTLFDQLVMDDSDRIFENVRDAWQQLIGQEFGAEKFSGATNYLSNAIESIESLRDQAQGGYDRRDAEN